MKSLLYFKALSDATRIRLLNFLIHHELSVNEIVSLMSMGQSRISRHLKILTDSSILECRRDGVWAFYSVSKEQPTHKFIDSIKYLFDNDPVLEKDLINASKIIEERKINSKHFFNKIAAEWDRLKKEILGTFDINKNILTYCNMCNVAVDLGCGTGDLLSCLKDNAFKLIGVDSSSKMLEEARKRFIQDDQKVDLRLGELEHLPIRDEEVDFVVISMVLHHLSDPEAAINEVCRILQKKGILIIADFEQHHNESMRKIYGDRWLGFTKNYIENILINQGFTLKSINEHKLKQSLQLNIYKSFKI